MFDLLWLSGFALSTGTKSLSGGHQGSRNRSIEEVTVVASWQSRRRQLRDSKQKTRREKLMAIVLVVVLAFLLGMTPPTTAIFVPPGGVAKPMAKPNCQEKCGDVVIPFPFGIGPNCFLDNRFEVECRNSTIPYHKYTELEILDVNLIVTERNHGSMMQTLEVRSPISFFNCAGKQNRDVVSYMETPFYLSSRRNVFAAVGCNVSAVLESRTADALYRVVCNTTCSSEYDFRKRNIPEDIPAHYNILFGDNNNNKNNNSAENECKFAFVIAEGNWYTRSVKEIRGMDFVPIVLEWKLNYSYFDLFRTNTYNTFRTTCSGSSTTLEPCSCNIGFRGNPYLIDGCQDIDECKEMARPCDGGTCVNTFGNYYCSNRRKFILIGFGSAFGALGLLFVSWGLYKLIKKRKEIATRKNFFKKNGGLLMQQQLASDEGSIMKSRLFTSSELSKATDHFSIERVLGQGGQGTVYKGMLVDGSIVAIKKSKVVDQEKLSEFINEVVILSQINHRNVVQLLGCCLETEVPMLVYEFIPNGTLSQYIHVRNEEILVTWKMRLRIATEIAGALFYLHSAASLPIYHRDIKSANILLDEKYKAKVADFGTSRTISVDQTHLTTAVYGTYGYLDPEYFQSSQFTDKSDVYSYGVVLVELLTGLKAVIRSQADEPRNLASYFIMSMEENALFDILDPQVLEDGPREEIISVANLALKCLRFNGRSRPTMKEVAVELEGLQKTKRSETLCGAQTNYEEIEFVKAANISTPWDSTPSGTGSTSNGDNSCSMVPELPLLSFEAR